MEGFKRNREKEGRQNIKAIGQWKEILDEWEREYEINEKTGSKMKERKMGNIFRAKRRQDKRSKEKSENQIFQTKKSWY